MAGIKNIIGGTFEDVGEAVIKPVKDEVGQALEQGTQTVINPLTPQQVQQRQQQDNLKLTEARRKLEWWKKLEMEQRQFREQEKQKQLQKQQVEEQQKQEKSQIKQFELTKKQQELHPDVAARGKAELKRGVGG